MLSHPQRRRDCRAADNKRDTGNRARDGDRNDRERSRSSLQQQPLHSEEKDDDNDEDDAAADAVKSLFAGSLGDTMSIQKAHSVSLTTSLKFY